MRELNHPHTVKLHEVWGPLNRNSHVRSWVALVLNGSVWGPFGQVFYAKRNIFLIMELAEGGELFDLLTSQQGDHFSEGFAADLMTQMLSAVSPRDCVHSPAASCPDSSLPSTGKLHSLSWSCAPRSQGTGSQGAVLNTLCSDVAFALWP